MKEVIKKVTEMQLKCGDAKIEISFDTSDVYFPVDQFDSEELDDYIALFKEAKKLLIGEE
jgi:hypothetical protein